MHRSGHAEYFGGARVESLNEQIQNFLSLPTDLHLAYSRDPEPGGGDGRGGGHGTAEGTGRGHGWAEGFGLDDLSGSGSGLDNAGGSGFEDCGGFGFGHAPGEGEAYDEAADYGDACTNSTGIKSLNGCPVHIVDGSPTIITRVKGNRAEGFVVEKDMALSPYYIVKYGGFFAFGRTAKQAYRVLAELLRDFDL